VELEEIQKQYGDPRRTSIASDEGEVEYTGEDFIVDEDGVVMCRATGG
jgi:DNA gyrase/topoisomerase IV subunit A